MLVDESNAAAISGSSVQPDVEAKVRKLSERPRSPAIFRLDPILAPLDERPFGQLFTLGENLTGQLGLDPDVENKKRPALVEGLTEIVSIVCGGMHTVCINKVGEVCLFTYTWILKMTLRKNMFYIDAFGVFIIVKLLFKTVI